MTISPNRRTVKCGKIKLWGAAWRMCRQLPYEVQSQGMLADVTLYMQRVAYLQTTTVWHSRLRQYRRACAKPWSEDMMPTHALPLCSPAKRSMLAMMS